jgi:serine/threonine-protein kinase PknG
MSDPCTHCGGTVVEDVCEDCGRATRRAALVKATTGGLDAIDAPSAQTMATGRTRSSTRFTVNYPSRAPGSHTTRRRAGVTTHTSTRRTALGGGLISLPDLPSLDPLKLLMTTPEVPLAKRRCPKCDKQVNRTNGFCPSCGAAYDFVPRLKAGDVIAGKYEIKGTIAFGGLGWIYLGWDRVLTRWVVLKGLLNANDEASAAAAVAERRYLAAVKHAKIVGIYDFVNHGAEGFIVMEYVGGVTVHSLRRQGPLAVTEAIAYVLGILPAFSYLHAQGLVYCDFKPDNVMVESGDVKLIDMGAVRKIGDPHGDIYATVGFAAPEADTDPIAASDLYTLGRTLAMLIMDFKFSSDFVDGLPSPDDQPVLADHESLFRFLLRATHLDPDERFQSADEMADQLFGVLREIVALQSGPKPVDSKVFTSDNLLQSDVDALLSGPQAANLPGLRVNLQDRAANEVVRVMSLMKAQQQAVELRALVQRYGDSAVEPRLRLAEVLIQNPQVAPEAHDAEIATALEALEANDPFDWRPQWMRGLWLLTRGQGAQALAHFERVYFEMPGELAPRLAMGFAAEMAGQHEQALPYYDRVGRVDPAHVTAHMGAARCHARTGHLDEAVATLQRVPGSHALRTQSQLAIGEMLLAHPDRLDIALMRHAESAVKKALPDGGMAHQLAGRLLSLALKLSRKLSWPLDEPFLGQRFQEHGLRVGAEAEFRKAAREAEGAQQRLHWVMQANRVRPVTLF